MKYPNLEKDNYTIVIPSNKPDKVERIIKSCPDLKMNHFDGTGYKSWTKMWNECVSGAPTDLVIICQDKSHPTMDDFEKALALLEEGFGSAHLYCVGFMSVHKYLMDKIGWMDERLNGAGHHDFMIRHKEADVAYYESLEVEYEDAPTTWAFNTTSTTLYKKWITDSKKNPSDFEQRILPDEVYDYKSNAEPREFLPYKDCKILTGNTKLYERRFVR